MGSKAGANKASQQQAAAAQQAAPAPAAAPQPQAESTDDKFAQLKELAGLHDSGVLTDEEFAAEKAKILG
jgi:membrane protease subunit (stomatin/prohibitin family)